MPTIRVDLTSKEASKIARSNRLIDRLRLASGVFIGLFVLVVAGIFGYFFYLNSRVASVDVRVQSITNQIQEKAETEVLYRRLADIAREANNLIQGRQDYAGVLLEVYALLPDQVQIEGVRFEDNSVIVDVRTAGVQDMNRTLNVLESIDGNDKFSGMNLESVRRADDGNYFIRIRLNLETA